PGAVLDVPGRDRRDDDAGDDAGEDREPADAWDGRLVHLARPGGIERAHASRQPHHQGGHQPRTDGGGQESLQPDHPHDRPLPPPPPRPGPPYTALPAKLPAAHDSAAARRSAEDPEKSAESNDLLRRSPASPGGLGRGSAAARFPSLTVSRG